MLSDADDLVFVAFEMTVLAGFDILHSIYLPEKE